MRSILLKRCLSSSFSSYTYGICNTFGLDFKSFTSLTRERVLSTSLTPNDSTKSNDCHHGIEFPHLIPSLENHAENFDIQLVDPDLWRVSFGLSCSSSGMWESLEKPSDSGEEDATEYRITNDDSMVGETPDFDAIEDLRIQKKLFYKLDKGSKEYEECNFSFHRKKSSKKKHERQSQRKLVGECKKIKMSNVRPSSGSPKEKVNHKISVSKTLDTVMYKEVTSMVTKKVRTPTFYQLTDPYHLPFCLDIFITKGSVRACIIHRVTSKVVSVAHSISKDMKFDLTSKKDATACAAVGEILAQRAIEDDIHNMVYTPRKGDKIEGKLQIVLQSIIDHGVYVKVKLKQKNLSSSLVIDKSEFLLGNVIDAVVSQVMVQLRDRDLQLIRDIPEEIKIISVYGDQVRIQQILADFLLSMAQYAPSRGGWVEIQVRPSFAQISQGANVLLLQFRIACPGEGLPAELVQALFRSSHWVSREGFGLSICRKLLKLMDGEVQYIRESERCYFFITIELPSSQKSEK